MNVNRIPPAVKIAIASAGAAFLALPAHAYSVSTLAETQNGLFGEYARGYNIPSYDQMSIGGGPGYTTFSSSCTSNDAACSVMGSGNTETSPSLTAASESTSVDVTTVPTYYYPLGLTEAASAYGSANLATGKIVVASTASGDAAGAGVSGADARDTLHFNVAGASAQTMTTIDVTYQVTGVILSPPGAYPSVDVSTVFELGGGYFEAAIGAGAGPAYLPVLNEAPPSGWLTQSLSPATPYDFTFHGTLALTGATESLGVVEDLYDNCGAGTTCDYSAVVSFTLPSNVTYTSDSGVFLSQSGAVPEPAAWALMLVGVCGLGGVLRRSRRPGMVA